MFIMRTYCFIGKQHKFFNDFISDSPIRLTFQRFTSLSTTISFPEKKINAPALPALSPKLEQAPLYYPKHSQFAYRYRQILSFQIIGHIFVDQTIITDNNGFISILYYIPQLVYIHLYSLASLNSPGRREQIPLDNFSGNMGMTRSKRYTLLPLSTHPYP